MPNVTIYGYGTSPFVRKSACFLLYKGIEFEHVPVNPLKAKETIGFTGKTQVPVLKIDDVWKTESSDHATWLDEVFPDRPLCPPEHHDRIKEIDGWISNSYLLNFFRPAIDGPKDRAARQRGWRLAELVNHDTPLPFLVRMAWPFLVSRAPFIRRMAQHMDLEESHIDLYGRLQRELLAHIGEGPFMGGLEHPTMLDLAVFPNIVWPQMFGIEKKNPSVPDKYTWTGNPGIKAWLRRVAEHLPANPTLSPDSMMVQSLDDILA